MAVEYLCQTTTLDLNGALGARLRLEFACLLDCVFRLSAKEMLRRCARLAKRFGFLWLGSVCGSSVHRSAGVAALSRLRKSAGGSPLFSTAGAFGPAVVWCAKDILFVVFSHFYLFSCAGAYMLHFPIIQYLVLSQQQAVWWSWASYLGFFWNTLFLSYASALVFYVVLEKPCVNLERLFLQKS